MDYLIDFVSKYSVVRKMQLTAGAEMGMPRSNEAGYGSDMEDYHLDEDEISNWLENYCLHN